VADRKRIFKQLLLHSPETPEDRGCLYEIQSGLAVSQEDMQGDACTIARQEDRLQRVLTTHNDLSTQIQNLLSEGRTWTEERFQCDRVCTQSSRALNSLSNRAVEAQAGGDGYLKCNSTGR
jgi:hypothetical protein